MSKDKANGNAESQSTVQPIRIAREIDFLFHKLVSESITLDCQQPDESVLKLTPEKVDSGYLICRTEQFEGKLETTSVSFMIEGVPYFGLVSLESTSPKEAHLKIPPEVFRIQRRQSHRLQLPADYGAVFQMNSPVSGSFRVEDLSGGGLQLLIPSTVDAIKEGEEVQGVLHLGKVRPPLALNLVVRRNQPKDDHFMLGLELHSTDQQAQMNFLHYVMEIYRQIHAT